MVGFLSCCLKGLEQTRAYNAEVAHLMLAALVVSAIGVLAGGAAAAWMRLR